VGAGPAQSRARGFRIVASACVLLLLAVVLTVVVAPWAPATAAAPAALFSGAAPTVHPNSTPPRETREDAPGSSPVSVKSGRTAVATG